MEAPDCVDCSKGFHETKGKSKPWCFLTLQVSDLLQENEQINELEQKHEDVCIEERTPEEQMAKAVVLEEQIKHLRDEQELLW